MSSFIGGLLAAVWKLGILATVGKTWALIGVIAIGIGIMSSVSSSGNMPRMSTPSALPTRSEPKN